MKCTLIAKKCRSYNLSVEISTKSLFAKILPVTEILSPQRFINVGFCDLYNEPVYHVFPKMNQNFANVKAVNGFPVAERKNKMLNADLSLCNLFM